ncbi:hypothetical protein GCK72_023098 [Caenorhabditis remanei]|uniref:Uncharacterized protein n=1 Tax=Caenorhabditis remanei TaxID=31234 RepID=A0A6A5FW19_CAERE|nr:hypothetical protein GCK72_023098 [Caenorhabditis remanei]KAF1746641.1 hypothetical protein GCK72_023098 [Caenorhabditis remanei]
MDFTPNNGKHGYEKVNFTATPPMPQLSQPSDATTLSQRVPDLARGVVQTSSRKGGGDINAKNVGKMLEKYMAVPEYNRKPLVVIMPKTELEIMLQNASANGFHGHFPGNYFSNNLNA